MTSAPPAAAVSPSTSGGLGSLLLHQLIQLTVLQHLAEGSQSKPENGDCGAELEGLLKRSCGAHLVVAQANAESATLTASGASAALTAAPPFSAIALSATFTLIPLLGIAAVGITHGLRPESGASVAHRR